MNLLINYALISTVLAFTYTWATPVNSDCAKPITENLSPVLKAVLRIAKKDAIQNTMNMTVDPCNDFYTFACGNWKRINPAVVHSTTDIFQGLIQLFDSKVESLLSGKIVFNYTAIDNKVKDFYLSCLDLVNLKDKYNKKLLDIIAEFGEMPALSGDKWNGEQFDWVETIAKIHRKYGIQIILGMVVMPDRKNNTVNRLYIGHADLELETCAMDLGNSSAVCRELKIAWQLNKFLKMNMQLATKTAKEILDFEMSLANGLIDNSIDQNRDESFKVTTIEEMQNEYNPAIDMKKLVNITMGVLVADPVYEYVEEYQRNLKKILPTTPRVVIANYIYYKLIAEFMLNVYQVPELKQTCISETKSHFYKNLNNMYYRKYITNEIERDVECIYREIKESFKTTLLSNRLSWIAEPTRQYALDKLEAIKLEINSYSNYNFTKEFGALVINNYDYLANVQSLLELNTERDIAKLYEAPENVDLGETISNLPHFIYSKNVIKLPVSYLQPHFMWSNAYPKAVKFSTLGMLVGHELLHAFDDTGRRYDKYGNRRYWWDEKSTETFVNRTECFSKQYSKNEYVEHLSPTNSSQSENINDNGGVRLAYDAYMRWYREAVRFGNDIGDENLPDLPYNNKQLFFISFAQMMCHDVHPEVKDLQIADQHAPRNLRVVGSLSNYNEFAEAFSCETGTRMNPVEKCEIY